MLPFLQRLKQRKIVQWAIAYFAGAWYHGERVRQQVGVMELMLVVVILGLGGQSIWVPKNRSDALALESATEPFQFREEPLPEHSVAVLPCANLSYDGVRNDPRFVELIRGLKLPEEIYLSPQFLSPE
jgi:hypothetical protein